MNDSLPTITAPDNAWISGEGWEDQSRLIGNRVAFGALRDAIDQLLSGETQSVWIDSEEMQIAGLQLQEVQDQIPPTTLKDKILICSIIAFFGFILLLGLGSLIAGVASLFS